MPLSSMLFLLVACHRDPSAEWTPVHAAAHWPDEAGEPIEIPDGLDAPWLADVSRYGFRGQSDDAGRSGAGAFGVGNGEVFGLIGLDHPANTLTNTVGPGYQVDEGFFGDAAVFLSQRGAALPIDAEVVQRPRGSLVVRTEATSGDLTLQTIDLAVPGQPAVARLITVQNRGPATAVDLIVRLALSDSDTDVVEIDSLVQKRGDRRMWVGCGTGTVSQISAQEAQIAVPVSLDEGEVSNLMCLHRFGTTEVPGLSGSFSEWLGQSRAATQAFLAPAAKLSLPDPKVADLVEGMLMTIYAQTAPIGVVSPMSRYTSGWLRDTEGPARLLLDVGLFAEVERMLDTTYAVALTDARIGNSFRLDADTDGEVPDDPESFWASVDFMPGREPVEAPSYPVLLHARYADYAGEPDWDLSRRAFLRACVERQEVEDGRLRFSGDETWRYPMGLRLGALPEELGWSSASSLLYLAASDALVRLGEPAPDTDVVRAALADFTVDGFTSPVLDWDGAPIPTPYEDVSALAWWLDPSGSLVPGGVTREQSFTAIDEAFSAGESDPLFAFTGMAPGQVLDLVAPLGDPEAFGRWFNRLDEIATPSGHFEEVHQGVGGVLSLGHNPAGTGADASARYRPWEGGDTVHALLHSLFGVDPRDGRVVLAPRLPPGVPFAEIDGLRLGTLRARVRVEAYAEGQVVVVQADEAGLLDLWLPIGEVWMGRDEERVDQDLIDGWRAETAAGGVWLRQIPLEPGQTLRVVTARTQ